MPPDYPEQVSTTPESAAPGPHDWLVLTVHIARDRSHSAWKFLADEELRQALAERHVVAAYLPGEVVATRDLVVVRLAVTADGRVALAPDAGPPTAGPQAQEFFPQLLEDLRTVGFVPPSDPVGPDWLPTEQILQEVHTPGPDSRVVYCYRGQDTVVAGAFARDLDTTLRVYREDGWVVAATGHQPAMVLSSPPSRLTGAFPFVCLDRRGQQRTFGYHEAAKASALHLSAEWQPAFTPTLPEAAGPAAHDLADWLTHPADHPERPHPVAGSSEPTPEQESVIRAWMQEVQDGAPGMARLAAAFGVPPVAAQLVESRPGDPDPPGGTLVEPASTASLLASAIAEEDLQPQGRMPWAVLERTLQRRPLLGVALGVLELAAAGLLILWLAGTEASRWWTWVVLAMLVLVGLTHLGLGILRLRIRSTRPASAMCSTGAGGAGGPDPTTSSESPESSSGGTP